MKVKMKEIMQEMLWLVILVIVCLFVTTVCASNTNTFSSDFKNDFSKLLETSEQKELENNCIKDSDSNSWYLYLTETIREQKENGQWEDIKINHYTSPLLLQIMKKDKLSEIEYKNLESMQEYKFVKTIDKKEENKTVQYSWYGISEEQLQDSLFWDGRTTVLIFMFTMSLICIIPIAPFLFLKYTK